MDQQLDRPSAGSFFFEAGLMAPFPISMARKVCPSDEDESPPEATPFEMRGISLNAWGSG